MYIKEKFKNRGEKKKKNRGERRRKSELSSKGLKSKLQKIPENRGKEITEEKKNTRNCPRSEDISISPPTKKKANQVPSTMN